jgi:hypothetical protein
MYGHFMLLQACHLLNGQLSNSLNFKSVLLCLLFIYTFIHCFILYQISVARRLWVILLGTNWSSGGINIHLSVINLWFLLDVYIFALFCKQRPCMQGSMTPWTFSTDHACHKQWRSFWCPRPQPLLSKMEVGTYVWISKYCDVLLSSEWII